MFSWEIIEKKHTFLSYCNPQSEIWFLIFDLIWPLTPGTRHLDRPRMVLTALSVCRSQFATRNRLVNQASMNLMFLGYYPRSPGMGPTKGTLYPQTIFQKLLNKTFSFPYWCVVQKSCCTFCNKSKPVVLRHILDASSVLSRYPRFNTSSRRRRQGCVILATAS